MLKSILGTLGALILLVAEGARAAEAGEFSCVVPLPGAVADVGPEIPGIGALFRETTTSWSVARIDARRVAFEKIPSEDSGMTLESLNWPGVGVLFVTDRWNLVRNRDGKIAI